jgi:signal transduction histidine kinase
MTQSKTKAAAGGDAPSSGRKRAAPTPDRRALRRLERRVEALRAELEALERDRAELCSVLSHDLRNPLTVVVWSTQILARRIGPEDASRRHLDAVARAAEELNQMLHDLSDAARIPDGRLPTSLSLEPCEPAALVEQAVASIRPSVESKRLAFTVAVAEGLPALRCDRERIARILGSLLSSAVRRTPRQAAVSLRVGFADTHPPGRMLRIVVEDCGPEVTPEDRDAAFRFPSAPPPGGHRRPRAMGPALSFFVARGVAEAHGGELDLQSDPDHGARFVLTLPVDVPPTHP